MISHQKTTVAVLRQELGLSAEEFGQLIGKSVSTVEKLDSGVLPLSEETAQTISKETGVDMRWLLAGEPKEEPYEPYFTDVENGVQPFTKEVFERVQARKQKPNPPLDPADYLAVSDLASIPFHMAYANAEKAGDGQLALHVYRKFLKDYVKRFGTDPEEFLRINKKARRTYANGVVRAFASAKALELKELGDVVQTRVGGPVHIRKRPTPKTLPVQDVPHDSNDNTDWDAMATAAPEPVHKKASPKRKAA